MNGTPTINDMMEAYAEDAVDHAQTAFGVRLDYSAESIREVEVVLGKLHALIPRGLMRLIRRAPSAEIIETFCKMYGGYIGEVYRRTVGGTWELRENIPGSEGPVLTVSSVGGSVIFPPAKVWKRIHNGKEDDVWFYFQVITKRQNNFKMSDLLSELQIRWLGERISFNKSATESQVEEFEAKYNIKIPAEFRQYLFEVNGMPEYELDGLAQLWPLEAIRRLSERFAEGVNNSWLPSEIKEYFVFGDYNIGGSLWAIKLNKNEEPDNPIIVVYATAQFYKKVADNFENFLSQYLTDGPESLI